MKALRKTILVLWEVKKFYPEEFKINTISIQLMNIYNG